MCSEWLSTVLRLMPSSFAMLPTPCPVAIKANTAISRSLEDPNPVEKVSVGEQTSRWRVRSLADLHKFLPWRQSQLRATVLPPIHFSSSNRRHRHVVHALHKSVQTGV